MTEQKTYIAQAAAIPFRTNAETGRPEVLLIRRTDKENGKWGIPKGLVDPGFNHSEAARQEALEEAGVTGRLSEEPLGSFTYEKFGGVCRVQVYAMKVTQVREHWEEEGMRERKWFDIKRAAAVVGRESIAALIRELAQALEEG